MLARRPIPAEYRAWNQKWSAPFGRQSGLAASLAARSPRLARRFPQLRGAFAFQPNNDTRRFEYPWAYFATPLAPGMRVLEIGGGLSGFQFVLAREGLEVVNVDPGLEATGRGWTCDAAHMAVMNRAFGTAVELRNTTLDRAGVPSASVDRVFSISTIEHIPGDELPLLAAEVRRVLRPGGYVVLTIDLFLDVAPFSDKAQNEYGRNVDVRALVEQLDLELVTGNPAELHGYPEFVPGQILAGLPSLVYGHDFPACAQLLVLRAP